MNSMTTLYNGTVYIHGLFNKIVGAIPGTTSSDTVLSLLNNISYNSSQRVMVEIGSYNTGVGNYGNIYRYAFGYSNTTGGGGGIFMIQGIPVSSNSYASTGTPITFLTISNLGSVSFVVDRWHTSLDGCNRFYFAVNGPTFFGNASQWYFQSPQAGNVVSIDPYGSIHANGSITAGSGLTVNGGDLNINNGNVHVNNGYSLTVAGSITAGSGSSVNGGDLSVNNGNININNGYSLGVSGHINTSGNITAGSGLTVNGGDLTINNGNINLNNGYSLGVSGNINLSGNIGGSGSIGLVGNITTSGIFIGNGSGLNSVPSANTANTATTAITASNLTASYTPQSWTVVDKQDINKDSGNQTLYFPTVSGRLFMMNLTMTNLNTGGNQGTSFGWLFVAIGNNDPAAPILGPFVASSWSSASASSSVFTDVSSPIYVTFKSTGGYIACTYTLTLYRIV